MLTIAEILDCTNGCHKMDIVKMEKDIVEFFKHYNGLLNISLTF